LDFVNKPGVCLGRVASFEIADEHDIVAPLAARKGKRFSVGRESKEPNLLFEPIS
jgi:hypothetical protein